MLTQWLLHQQSESFASVILHSALESLPLELAEISLNFGMGSVVQHLWCSLRQIGERLNLSEVTATLRSSLAPHSVAGVFWVWYHYLFSVFQLQ